MRICGDHWVSLQECMVPDETGTWPVWQRAAPIGYDLRLDIWIRAGNRQFSFPVKR